jgi:hypothetical protein
MQMRLTTVVLTLLVASTTFRPGLQSQATPAAQTPILGNLVQGTYSNTILGIKFELPADWQIDNLDESEDLSRHFPRRMHLRFKSNEDWIILSASPIEPDEKLQHVFRISLMGAKDGGGFHAVGEQTKEIRDGYEVLGQKLTRRLSSGPAIGVYRAFFSRGYYISVLHFGPPSTEEGRERIVKNLHILSDDSR